MLNIYGIVYLKLYGELNSDGDYHERFYDVEKYYKEIHFSSRSIHKLQLKPQVRVTVTPCYYLIL